APPRRRAVGASRGAASPVEPVARRVRLVSAGQPEGPAESPGTRGGPRHVEPAPIHLVRLVRVDQDVAVAVVHAGPLDPHLLVPAVLAADPGALDAERP